MLLSEKDLWDLHLKTHIESINSGKPSGLRNLRNEIIRLHGDLNTLNERKKIADEAGALTVSAVITNAIKSISLKLKDLQGLTISRIPSLDDIGPTPEVMAKPAIRDPILVLEEADRAKLGSGITSEQAANARLIARIHEAITRAGMARASKMEVGLATNSDPQASGMPDWLDELRHKVYLPWCSHAGTTVLSVTQSICVYGVSISVVRRKYHRGYYWVLGTLRNGLDMFAAVKRGM